jgi:hypothetical protein
MDRMLRVQVSIDPVEDPQLYEALAPLQGHVRGRRVRALMRAGFVAVRDEALSITASFASAHAGVQPRLFDLILFAFKRGFALLRRAMQWRSSLRGRRRCD